MPPRIWFGSENVFLSVLVKDLLLFLFADRCVLDEIDTLFELLVRIVRSEHYAVDTDVVMFTIKKFGVDSIIFGTDCPYEDLKQIVDTIENLPISEEDKDKIFYKNAEKYLLKK